MKRFCSVVLTLCLILSAFGCSHKNVSACLSFSEYYQSADDFDEISPHLEKYFSLIETAYENSDKKRIASFALSGEYDEVRATLRSFHESLEKDRENLVQIKDKDFRATAEEAYLAKVGLLLPYLQIEAEITEQKLMLLASPNAKDEDWFAGLNTIVKDSVKEYLIGTGE